MYTQITLEGAMGAKFGRDWSLVITSPMDALRIIDANVDGLFIWVKQNIAEYGRYRLVCEFEDGRIEYLDNESVFLESVPVKIHVVPLIEGASAGGRFIFAAVLIAASFIPGLNVAVAAFMLKAGASMMIGSVVEMLTPKPKKDDNTRVDKTSHYFGGPVNTTMQGVAVPLIYGRVLVGSHNISAALSIDQLIAPDFVASAPVPPLPVGAGGDGWTGTYEGGA